MISQEDLSFLTNIKEYVKSNPHLSTMVSEYAQQGLSEKLQEAREVQMKTEVALMSALNRKYKDTNETTFPDFARSIH